jgi:deoxyribonuclease V
MKIHNLHAWDLTPTEAVALQRKLADRIDTRTPLTRCELVAGADISYERFSDVFYAGVVVVRVADGEVIERRSAVKRNPFPYIPGLLSFREAPALLEAFAQIESEPDAIMFDGQGYAHPRRFGLTCHVGLFLEKPCLGCAKSLLTGTFKEPRPRAGSLSPLIDKGEVIGNVVRTKNKVKPVYVSVGHRIDLPSAVRVALQTTRGYRIPEPTRQAHLYVNRLRAAKEGAL